MQVSIEVPVIEVKQMWPNGPFRQFSTIQPNFHWKPYESATLKGYAGGYVCGTCRKVVFGVHWTLDGWKCGQCRRNRKPQPQSGKNDALCMTGGVQ